MVEIPTVQSCLATHDGARGVDHRGGGCVRYRDGKGVRDEGGDERKKDADTSVGLGKLCLARTIHLKWPVNMPGIYHRTTFSER